MATYKAAYLYEGGGIECGDVIHTIGDANAIAQAKNRAKARHATLFGLHEVTGKASDSTDRIRPIDYRGD